MSIAGRHGKLRVAAEDDGTRFRRLEDLLTADVFGAYRYLPAHLGVRLFLEEARSAEGSSLRAWTEERGVAWPDLSAVTWLFWPSLDEREPDLVVALGDAEDPARLLVLIEVKLHAEQHEIGGVSQLGFYGSVMLDDRFDDEPFDFELPLHRPVILVTKDQKPPVEALLRARRELGDHHALGHTDAFWISWTTVATLAAATLANRTDEGAPEHELRLHEDLVADLAERGFGRPRALTSLPVPLPAPLPPIRAPWSVLCAPRRVEKRTSLVGIQLKPIDSLLTSWRLR